MHGGRSAPTRRRGFSLVELVVAVAVLSVVLGAVGLFQSRSQAAARSALARAQAETSARRTLDRVAEELTGVGHSLIFPDPTSSFGTSTLSYQRPTGVDGGGTVTWSTQSRLALVLEPGETDNGIDDDSDGLIDERRLVLTRNVGAANQQQAGLCGGIPRWLNGETSNGVDDNGNGLVDEAGFCVLRVGDLLTVRISVQEPAGQGQVVTSTLETSIVLHN